MADFELWRGHDFSDALNRLSGRFENQTLMVARRLVAGDKRAGLNDELLHRFDCGLEVRSARVTKEYRLVFAKTENRVVLLWVGKHDEAYAWKDRHLQEIPRRSKVLQRHEPVPSVASQDPTPITEPDKLGALAARGYQHYFAALDEAQRFLVTFDASKTKQTKLSFVTAGAGTGKTSIAIHRALRQSLLPGFEDGRVLYLCFNRVLMRTVREAIRTLAPPERSRQIEVNTFHGWAGRYLRRRVDSYSANPAVYDRWLRTVLAQEVRQLPDADRRALERLAEDDLFTEISDVLGPNQFDEVQPYLDLNRPESEGLVRLFKPQRRAVWALYQRIRHRRDAQDSWNDLIERARAAIAKDPNPPRYRDVIVDEGQDCSPVMARLAKALVAGAETRLLVLADPAQALYAGRYRWAAPEFGSRRGRTHVLREPYRSTRQLHALAASIYANVDEVRRDVEELSTPKREGPLPRLARCAEGPRALAFVVESVLAEIEAGRPVSQIAVLTGSNPQRDEARVALERAGVPVRVVDRNAPPDGASVALATVHSAKGLDFASVYLLDPVVERFPIDRQRAQLYVAITRSSRSLSIVCCANAHTPLIDCLDRECYEEVAPSAA